MDLNSTSPSAEKCVGERFAEVLGERLVERLVLLVGDVGRVARPQRLRVVHEPQSETVFFTFFVFGVVVLLLLRVLDLLVLLALLLSSSSSSSSSPS